MKICSGGPEYIDLASVETKNKGTVVLWTSHGNLNKPRCTISTLRQLHDIAPTPASKVIPVRDKASDEERGCLFGGILSHRTRLQMTRGSMTIDDIDESACRGVCGEQSVSDTIIFMPR